MTSIIGLAQLRRVEQGSMTKTSPWRRLHANLARLLVNSIRAGIVLLTAVSGSALARDLTIVGWGGPTQEIQGRLYVQPFAESRGIRYLEDVYLGGWGVFQAMKDTGQASWDVVQVESAELMRGCEEGVFAPIDWARVADPSMLVPEGVSECGVGVSIWAALIAFNPDTIGTRPTTLEDFWDLETWPGNRGLRQGPKINLELALMADGVPPRDVYRTLSSPEGIDRAFRKLDEIKPVLRLWKSGNQGQELITSGEVAIGIIYNSRLIRLRNEDIPIDAIWDRAVYDVDSLVILANSPHIDLAHEFLYHYVHSDKHLELMNTTFGTKPIRHIIDEAGLKFRSFRPLGRNIESALFMGSQEGVEFWLNHQESLTQRWNAWAATE